MPLLEECFSQIDAKPVPTSITKVTFAPAGSKESCPLVAATSSQQDKIAAQKLKAEAADKARAETEKKETE